MATNCLVPIGKSEINTGTLLGAETKADIVTGALLGAESVEAIGGSALINSNDSIGLAPLGGCAVSFIDVLINFALTVELQPGANFLSELNSTTNKLLNTDGSEISGSISASNIFNGLGGDTSGIGTGTHDLNIYNDAGNLSGVFGDTSNDITLHIEVDLSLSGISPIDTYTVRVASSRSTNDGRRTTVIVDGVSIEINVESPIPEVAQWLGVLGSDLISQGITAHSSGFSTFSYLNLIQITKE